MAQLFHADGDLKWRSPTIKADFSTPPIPSSPSFPSDDNAATPTMDGPTRDKIDLALSTDESRSTFKFTWNFEAGVGDGSGSGGDMSLTFIRFLIVHNIKRERDVKLGVYCVNLASWRSGAFQNSWSFYIKFALIFRFNLHCLGHHPFIRLVFGDTSL